MSEAWKGISSRQWDALRGEMMLTPDDVSAMLRLRGWAGGRSGLRLSSAAAGTR